MAEPDLLPHQARVRLTIRPDELTVVPADEIPHLRGSGLLIEDEPGPAAAKAPGKPADKPKEPAS